MFHRFLVFAAMAAALLSTGRLYAGGPPWLCIPIDGVTSGNAKACTELINAKLGSKMWQHDGRYDGGAQLRLAPEQYYLAFYMQEDVGIGEIEGALKGSEFSVPRDKLRLFGHVILEIEVGKSSAKELVTALGAIANVSIDKVEGDKERLVVTAQMPYPVVDERPTPESVGWDKFAWNDYTSQAPKKSESPISSQALPSYETFRDVAAKHNASLKEVRWSTEHACRALGCVTAQQSNSEIAVALERTSAKSN
jgi:hypothetical protein